jgi:hypothetical protein
MRGDARERERAAAQTLSDAIGINFKTECRCYLSQPVKNIRSQLLCPYRVQQVYAAGSVALQ